MDRGFKHHRWYWGTPEPRKSTNLRIWRLELYAMPALWTWTKPFLLFDLLFIICKIRGLKSVAPELLLGWYASIICSTQDKPFCAARENSVFLKIKYSHGKIYHPCCEKKSLYFEGERIIKYTNHKVYRSDVILGWHRSHSRVPQRFAYLLLK